MLALAVRLLPVALACALLAAHFYRAGGPWPGALALLPMVTLFVPRRWAARVVQAALALGTVEWLRTAAALVAERQSMDAPWLRLALILCGVALLTAACLLVFRWSAVRRHFRLRPPAATDRPPS